MIHQDEDIRHHACIFRRTDEKKDDTRKQQYKKHEDKDDMVIRKHHSRYPSVDFVIRRTTRTVINKLARTLMNRLNGPLFNMIAVEPYTAKVVRMPARIAVMFLELPNSITRTPDQKIGKISTPNLSVNG
jgi:hypothetical protein